MMRSWALLMLLCCLLVPTTAAADDGSLGRSGETVFPMGEPTVRMEAEEVLLRIDPERTAVSLSFTFANSGPAKQVLMGFPLQQTFEGRGHPELNEFTTRVDGTAVPVVTEKASAGEYPGWITWPVAFGANQTVTVTNSYWGTNTYWSNGDTLAGYILKTGAVWNGTIGRARV
ncbi:MAG TPA: hypothetical protein VNT75_22495, partial [Symbiobacteriaceae bacterium]|nr:hypothetical protein [Symbiobacteriaceae bacterium]